MKADPIIDEVRQGRQEHAAKFDYDLKAIFDDLKSSERESGVRTVECEPKFILRKAQ